MNVTKYLGILCATAAASAEAITIANFSSTTNDRFANNPSFIMNGFNVTGVGLSSNAQNQNRWVTMISPNVFLSSEHFFPSNGSTVTFFETNNANGPSISRTVMSSQRVVGGANSTSSDIRIGVLDSPVSTSIAHYNFATDDTTTGGFGGPSSFNTSPYNGLDAYIFGRSPTALSVSTDIAVGRNVIDSWFDSVDAAGTIDDAIGSRIDAVSDPDYTTYEAQLQGGDSGAPMFVDVGGELVIVGLNWFVGTAGSDTFNGQSYIGNYDSEIQAFIDANAIPETSTTLILGFSSLLLMLHRRR